MNDLNISRPIEGCLPPATGEARAQRRGFSLIEILVVVSLLSLIVLVLMTVFNSTQSAFRAGITQTDVLEGSRSAMDLIVSDLKLMSPSYGPTNNPYLPPGTFNFYDYNFFSALNYNISANYYLPLIQNLPGSGQLRTNVLENIFWLSRQNINGHDSWVGTGYTVIATNVSPLFPLYRFVTNAPASTDPTSLLFGFLSAIQNNAYTNTGWSHLIDGVLDFRVQPFDLNGYAMTNSSQFNANASQPTTYPSTAFFYQPYGITGFYFLSNSVPASVEIQMSSLEDAALRRAESFGLPGIAQSNYLAQQAGRVHVFRQRVMLPNVDQSAYP
jgi:prepilin-type N-terminal cleavage/methylation domain-containing protein